MKHLLLCIFILAAGKAFGQVQANKPVPIITAKEAYQYVGQLVVVRDSIYSGRIVNDTTAVCQLGEKTNTPRLTMIFISPGKYGPLDQRFFTTFQRYQLSLYAIITGSKEAPVIIIHNGTNEFSFYYRHRG